jgi:type II secretory pathway component GspD/PulD (secretin)
LAKSGLGYFLTLYDLNLSAVIKAVSSDTRTKVVSTPVLLTTDNTEAKLSATEKIYVYKGTPTYYSGSVSSRGDSQYSQQDIGLELTVTPHINENKVVMMEIVQKISEPGDQSDGDINNLQGKTISRDRTIEASIAVKSGQTIVLGGQVREGNKRTRTKVPLLGDIPLLGRLFNSDSRSKARTETIVFITPYVLDTPDEVSSETKRRRDSLNIKGMWKKGWSGSDLAEDPKTHWWNRSSKDDAVRSGRDFKWETSGGKSARGGRKDVDVTGDSEPRRARSYEEVESDVKEVELDVDDFLRKQREKWNKALDKVE